MATTSQNENLIITNNNLIETSMFAEDWQTIILSDQKSDQKAKWQKNENGIILTKPVGSRKSASGVLLINNKIKIVENQSIHLEVILGSTHQIGLVFNYLDNNDFCLFLVDQHSNSYRGYHILIQEVRQGNCRTIAKENYAGRPNNAASFDIIANQNSLDFIFTGLNIFQWNGRGLDAGLKVGLYSQRNNDSLFTGLQFIEQQQPKEEDIIPLPINTATANVKVADPIVDTLGENDQKKESRLIPFVKLQSPKSKTQINFNEVFTVPLDSFYSRLYQNDELLNIYQSQNPDESLSKYHQLDFRPQRWYKDFRKITDIEDFLHNDEQRLKGLIKKLSEETNSPADGSTPSSTPEDLLEKLNTMREEYMDTVYKLNEVREKKSVVLRDINTNSYSISFDNIPSAIEKMGYNFRIKSAVQSIDKFTPVPVLPGFDYFSSDAVWKSKIIEKLDEKLLDTGLLSEDKKARYLDSAEKLSTIDVSEIPLKINDLKADQEKLSLKKSSTDDIENEIADWKADRDTLLNESYNHPSEFYEDEFEPFPQDENPPSGEAKMTKFRNWLYQDASPDNNSPHPGMPQTWLNNKFDFNENMLNISMGSKTLNKLKIDIGHIYNLDPRYIVGFGLNYHNTGFGYLMAHKKYSYRDPDKGYYYGYAWHGNRNLGEFFKTGINICNYYIGTLEEELLFITNENTKIQLEINLIQKEIERLENSGLEDLRKEFLAYWNNPEALDTVSYDTNTVSPDVDPLADLLMNLPGEPTDYKTSYFQFIANGFYDQNGQSLLSYGKTAAEAYGKHLVVLPSMDKNGKISEEIVTAIENPRKAQIRPNLPKIKFVETYQLEIVWKGYSLGELSHSLNLFPGETKEVVIEKTTNLQIKTSESTTDESSTSSKTTSSFEDNLKTEFSESEKASSEETIKTEDTITSSNTTAKTDSDTKQFKFSIPLGGIGKLGASIDSKSTDTRNTAFNTSQKDETQTATQQSSEILKKNVHNVIDKVATETSINNRVEVTSSTSREFTETSGRKETLTIENPNIGKTINYNFFQLQNIYEISSTLVDVKIVVDPGIEILKNSKLDDIRVLELEEFGKLYANLEQDDPHSAILATILARQVFKRYCNFMPGITTGNGAVRIPEGYPVNPEMMNILNLTDERLTVSPTEDILTRVEIALGNLQKVPFSFKAQVVGETKTTTVNTGAYYLESEIGERPSTEQYLEDRREIETEQQIAELDYLKARIKAKKFYPEIPDSVTHLNYDNHSVDNDSTDKKI